MPTENEFLPTSCPRCHRRFYTGVDGSRTDHPGEFFEGPDGKVEQYCEGCTPIMRKQQEKKQAAVAAENAALNRSSSTGNSQSSSQTSKRNTAPVAEPEPGNVPFFIAQVITGILFVYDLGFILSLFNIYLNVAGLSIIMIVAGLLTQITSDSGLIIKLISFIAQCISPFCWFNFLGVFKKIIPIAIVYGILIIIAIVSKIVGFAF